jgi:spermidine synthase
MWLYRLVAFLSGLVVLVIEVTAFRIVAPYFGNSIFITTNLLGVILGALALGYWLGGRLADRSAKTQPNRSARVLFLIMMIGALVIGLIPFVAPTLLEALRDRITGVDSSLVIFSLLGSLAIFFIPFVLLGMVSPWLVRLATQQVSQAGRTAGSLFAWSTLGSLVGTFLPTLVLVPLVGSKKTILLSATLLALVAALGLVKKVWLAPVAVLLVSAVAIPSAFASSPRVLEERESNLEYLRVVRDSQSQVHLEQDEGLGVHSVFNSNQLATGMVFDWMSLAPTFFAPDQDLQIAIIGLAGGTTARQIAAWYGGQERQVHIDGVELDPATLDLAKKYFELASVPNLTTEAGDGRVWLATSEKKYDVIIIDAFRQLYIPPHISSKEFFELVRQRLAPGGLAVLNLNVTDQSSLVYRKVAATVREVFPQVLATQVPDSFNVLFWASERELSKEQPATNSNVTELARIAKNFAQLTAPVQPSDDSRMIATDDRPLVESLYDLMIAQWLTRLD